jgi:hypothetical protein
MLPSTMRVGGQSQGVSIVAGNLRDLDAAAYTDEAVLREKPSALNALAAALLFGAGGFGSGVDEALPEGFFRIIVGPKP